VDGLRKSKLKWPNNGRDFKTRKGERVHSRRLLSHQTTEVAFGFTLFRLLYF
jgi:hypothetical protein